MVIGLKSLVGVQGIALVFGALLAVPEERESFKQIFDLWLAAIEERCQRD
jgi:hypothetical protein